VSGSSGTYAFRPALSELVLDAYERCGKLGVELSIQNQMLSSARRSANLVLSSWANRGVNLWTVDEVSQFMPQGVAQYFDDASCIDVLADSVVLRQYLMAASASVAVDFSTTNGSATVTIAGFTDTPIVGGYVNVGVMVSVGGLILDGFYQVVSVPSSGSVTVTASANATSTVTSGGAVPIFSTLPTDATVTVALNDHGLVAGETFTVEVSTNVGGLTLLGPYTVGSGPLTNSFTFEAPYAAGFAETVSENDGETQLATQTNQDNVAFNSNPTDLSLYALSRGNWMQIPNKNQAARPTSYWLDRQVVPVFNVWPVPDASGPYELRYRRSRQVQDADLISGQQMEIPYRFLESFTAELAAHLAMKFAPDRLDKLAAYAAMQWQMAADEDIEKVTTYLGPDMSSFYTP
jgi:hypothetical protein